MNFKNLMLLILMVSLFASCSSVQPRTPNRPGNTSLPPMEPGKCFGKSLFPDQYDTTFEEYVVFTGDESAEQVDIEIRQIELKAATTKWEKKQAPSTSPTVNPDEAIVWCLVEIPAEKKELKILKDTTQSKNYIIEKVEINKLARKGGFTDWVEVVCKGQVTKGLVAQVQQQLTAAGYYQGDITTKMNAQTKSALSKFQQENKLPVGQLDFETLEMLGVKL